VTTRWLLILLSLALVLVVTWWESEQRSGPGPLHPTHARVAELQGRRGCAGCHGSGEPGAMALACGSCHAAVAGQLQSGRGIHGAMAQATAVQCGRCHPEHHGKQAPLLGARSFALAGIPDARAYRHQHVAGFPLGGVHAALACERCHPAAFAATAPAGGRFLGRSSDCTSCHRDRHGGAFGADCGSCHGQERPFPDAPAFVHAGLPLQGAHGRVACAGCHPDHGGRDVASLRATPLPARGCSDCHANPHRAGDGGGHVASLPLRAAADCARCHTADSWAAARPGPDAHAAFGFALRGVHAGVSCALCHGGYGSPPRLPQPAPGAGDCAACHAHPHRPDFVTAAAAPGGCASCHAERRGGFRTGTVTAAAHAATGLALEGPHAGLSCAQCHGSADRAYAERHPGRQASDCRACHRDPHGGQFDRDPRYAQCSACHAGGHFVPTAFDAAAHARTAFPLHGLHEAVACRLCHLQDGTSPRTFAGTAQDCAHCHRDPHAGAFDRPGLPQQVGGQGGCARCHDPHGFAAAATDFDHAAWTRFALAGAHRQAACAACHAGAARAAAGRACGDCHADPHLGQFARAGATDCARCHSETSFRELHFDHARDSSFALDRVHAKLPCGACHKPVDTPRGPVTRWRPLGTRCGDCHVPGAPREAR
jgi:hypothetical protein